MHNRLYLIIVLLLALIPVRARAQETIPVLIDVFIEQDPQTGAANIYFVDALSGLSTVISADGGQNFTLVGDYVLYQKNRSGAIMRANADGIVEPHPFITRTANTQMIRWVTSPDARAVGWIQLGNDGMYTAYVAWADGSDLRQIPVEQPVQPMRLEPVALSNGRTLFFYDSAHPAESTAPFIHYQHIRAFNLINNQTTIIPGEPNCLCGAAITPEGRTLARMEAASATGPFDLHLWDLPAAADLLINAPGLRYPLAGDLVLSSTGTIAAYSASDPSTGQYALILVDTITRQQIMMLDPGPTLYRPRSFIDQDSALLLTGGPTNETYKFSLLTGEIQRVSARTYLGTISRTG